uniref:Uncharacterized protein n=1 Tax=Oryza glaberrima TaxID=4538 RepID=I1NQ62_ORYGL
MASSTSGRRGELRWWCWRPWLCCSRRHRHWRRRAIRACSASGTRLQTPATSLSSTATTPAGPRCGHPTARPSSTAPPAAPPTAASSSTSLLTRWGCHSCGRTGAGGPRGTSPTGPTSRWAAPRRSARISTGREACTCATPCTSTWR